MISQPPPMLVTETTRAMTCLANQVEAQPTLVMYFPPALIDAARRIVAATATHPGVSNNATVVPLGNLPVSQLVVQLVTADEVVDAAILRDRLAAIDRPTKTSAIGVALHRAVQRGVLERVVTGRYRQPARPESADRPLRDRSEEVPHHDPKETPAAISKAAAM